MAFFSVAGFFHEYYLSILGAPLAALVGAGAAELWRLRGSRGWLAPILLLAGSGATLAYEHYVARSFTTVPWWVPAAYGLLALGAVALVVSAWRTQERLAAAGFAFPSTPFPAIIPADSPAFNSVGNRDTEQGICCYDRLLAISP